MSGIILKARWILFCWTEGSEFAESPEKAGIEDVQTAVKPLDAAQEILNNKR